MSSIIAIRRNRCIAKQQRRCRPLTVSLLAAALLTIPVLSYARSVPDTSHATAQTFDIPASSLADALTSFGMQSGLQVTFAKDVVAGVRSDGLKGSYTPAQALTELLRGKALEYAYLNSNTVVIRKATSKTPKSKSETAQSTDEDIVGMPAEMEAIVVTGTRIRGLANPTIPVKTYEREEIERSGFTTTQEFIRSLPQNFKGGTSGASEDGIFTPNGSLNLEIASGANLRGMGDSATLVLVDGHRVALSATGTVVDLSMIPISAIDRIDVLTDGASAVYGADAVGGVINIMLRKSYDGAETRLVVGKVSSGSRNENTLGQTFGYTWGTGRVLASAQYFDASALPTSERSFTKSAPQPQDIYPAAEKYAGMLSLQQNLAPGIDVFGDILANRNEQSRRITTPDPRTTEAKTDSISINIGARFGTGDDWRFEASGLYSQVDTDYRITSGASPLIAPPAVLLPGKPYIRQAYTMDEGLLKADGTVFSLPAGNVKAAFGGSYRSEEFTSLTIPTLNNQRFGRSVVSLFGELNVPVLAPRLGGRGGRVDATAAVRYDHYSNFGDTTNPQLGFAWYPTNDLKVRASYGTSFRVPTAAELSVSSFRQVFAFPGWASPAGGTTSVLLVRGAELTPENSRNVSIGADYEPTSMPGASFSINYYNIDFKDRIISFPVDRSALLKPDVYGSIINRFESDAEVAEFVASQVAAGSQFFNLNGDAGIAGIRYSIPFLYTNAARVRTSGIDLGARYDFGFGENVYGAGINATYIREIRTSFCRSCDSTDISNTFGQPTRLRVRTDARWSRNEWEVASAVNFANSYSDTSAIDGGSISSYTTVDISVRYFPKLLSGVTLGLNIVNALNVDAPRAGGGLSGTNYDPSNASPIGRFVSLQAKVAW